MSDSDDFMSGRNQARGNRVAMIISIILLAGFIIGFIIFGR